MSKQNIEIVQDFKLPVGEVFARLADHNRLSKILGVPVRRVRDGEGDLNGVGSVRRIGVRPLAFEETVTTLVPDQTIAYRITKGAGSIGKTHAGKLEFSGAGDTSRVTWTVQFEAPPGVGAVVGFVLRQALRRGLNRIR